MNQKMWYVFWIQILVIGLLIGITIFIIQSYQKIKYAKRFEPFSLLSSQEKDLSIFDSLYFYFQRLVHAIATFLKRFSLFRWLASKYDPYLKGDETKKEGMDYVVTKCFLGLFLVLLKIITVLFQKTKLTFFFFVVPFLVGYLIPDLFLFFRYKRDCKQIEDDLLQALTIMNHSFKSGLNIVQAIKTVEKELTGPIAFEFKKMDLDISYGLSLDVVFNRFYERIKLDDVKYIATSLTILNQTGGDIVKVFETIESSIYAKKRLQKELHSLTSGGVLLFRVLVCLPFVLALIIYLFNPHYFDPFYQTKIGFIILIIILLLYILYLLLIHKVMKVKIK